MWKFTAHSRYEMIVNGRFCLPRSAAEWRSRSGNVVKV